MKSKILKSILYSLLIVFVIICLMVAAPRVLSAFNRDKPPLGYGFIEPAYLALLVGLEDLVNLTPQVPDSIEEIKDIEYKKVGEKSLQLDIYRPKNLVKPAPLLLFIHGGGWKGGKRSDYLVYLLDFAKRGYVTATVSYRLLNDGPYPACAEDIRDAVKWFYRNGETYGYDPDRIALIGGSAGAHLAMLTAYGWGDTIKDTIQYGSIPESRSIKAVVDIYGPFDMTTDYARVHPLVTNFIGASYDVRPELYEEASPAKYLDRDDPPTLILHGTTDKLVPVSQSDTLKARLDRLGVPNEYYRLPLWPHTMDVVKRVNDYCQVKMTEFFKEYL